MVLIFSGHANASPQVRREVERAISRGMAVVPVRVEDVRPDGALEYALGNTHWLDAFSPPAERQWERLARSVKTLLGDGVRPVAAEPEAAPARAVRAGKPGVNRRTEPTRDVGAATRGTGSSDDADPAPVDVARRARLCSGRPRSPSQSSAWSRLGPHDPCEQKQAR